MVWSTAGAGFGAGVGAGFGAGFRAGVLAVAGVARRGAALLGVAGFAAGSGAASIICICARCSGGMSAIISCIMWRIPLSARMWRRMPVSASISMCISIILRICPGGIGIGIGAAPIGIVPAESRPIRE